MTTDERGRVLAALDILGEAVRGRKNPDEPKVCDEVRNALRDLHAAFRRWGYTDDRVVAAKTTHYEGCWDAHFDCALARIEELEREIKLPPLKSGGPIEA
jgi:hypothetical protein